MTTLMYAVLAPGEIGVDTSILMIIAIVVELTTWGIGAFANRKRMSNFDGFD
jgi:hypothetical protein